MTIDEAIRVMEDNRDFFTMDRFVKCAKACQLGIEALKAVKGSRDYQFLNICPRLPSETKD